MTKYVKINHNMDNTDFQIINVVGVKNQKTEVIVFNYTWYKNRDGHQCRLVVWYDNQKYSYSTSGGGYCKQSFATSCMIQDVFEVSSNEGYDSSIQINQFASSYFDNVLFISNERGQDIKRPDFNKNNIAF